MAAKRTLDGPEGWFPRSKKSFLEVIEFRGGSASAVDNGHKALCPLSRHV